MRLKVGVLGCGTIGKEIIKSVHDGEISDMILTGVFDRSQNKLEATPISTASMYYDNPIDLAEECDIVVECAGHEIVKNYAVPILETGTDLIILSVGALSDPILHNKIHEITQSTEARLEVPSGALVGLDGIKAAAVRDELEEVIFTTIKPPRALEGAPYIQENDINLNKIQDKRCIFNGTATEAATAFPANINVAMAVSLAGVGPKETKVEIFADPNETDNVHITEAEGRAGKMKLSFFTKPHPDNPKTSYIAALSAIESLRRRTAKVIVGT